jgi:hypothetical protein
MCGANGETRPTQLIQRFQRCAFFSNVSGVFDLGCFSFQQLTDPVARVIPSVDCDGRLLKLGNLCRSTKHFNVYFPKVIAMIFHLHR